MGWFDWLKGMDQEELERAMQEERERIAQIRAKQGIVEKGEHPTQPVEKKEEVEWNVDMSAEDIKKNKRTQIKQYFLTREPIKPTPIEFNLSQPEDIDVNEILYRPTRQEL